MCCQNGVGVRRSAPPTSRCSGLSPMRGYLVARAIALLLSRGELGELDDSVPVTHGRGRGNELRRERRGELRTADTVWAMQVHLALADDEFIGFEARGVAR